MNKNGSLCILGGMGPEASSYMYRMMIDLSIKHFGIQNNDGFPDITLFSVPVPDFIANRKNQEKAFAMLQEKIQVINTMQANCVAIACNTAHLLFPALQDICRVPFVSMIDAVVEEVAKGGCTKVGLLGTPTTLTSGLYQHALMVRGIQTVVPEKEEILITERVIRRVIAGNADKTDRKILAQIADSLCQKGSEGIILGCTELPLIFPSNFSVPYYNSLEILVTALLKRYYSTCRIGV